MENGLRTLNIASLNPDLMKGKETQQEIINNLTRNKIQIAMIQETHIVTDLSYMMDNYRVITTAAEKHKETGTVTGGTAILIHESLQQNITQITRRRSRAMRVTLGHFKAKMPIHILPTYAPHNGYSEEIKNQHWENVQELLNKTCKRHLIIWGAHANGQLGNKDKTDEGSTAKKSSVEGYNWAVHQSLHHGKGKWSEPAQNMPQTADDTNGDMEKPKIQKQDRWKQQQGNMTKKGWEAENEENTSPHGQSQMEI